MLSGDFVAHAFSRRIWPKDYYYCSILGNENTSVCVIIFDEVNSPSSFYVVGGKNFAKFTAE